MLSFDHDQLEGASGISSETFFTEIQNVDSISEYGPEFGNHAAGFVFHGIALRLLRDNGRALFLVPPIPKKDNEQEGEGEQGRSHQGESSSSTSKNYAGALDVLAKAESRFRVEGSLSKVARADHARRTKHQGNHGTTSKSNDRSNNTGVGGVVVPPPQPLSGKNYDRGRAGGAPPAGSFIVQEQFGGSSSSTSARAKVASEAKASLLKVFSPSVFSTPPSAKCGDMEVQDGQGKILRRGFALGADFAESVGPGARRDPVDRDPVDRAGGEVEQLQRGGGGDNNVLEGDPALLEPVPFGELFSKCPTAIMETLMITSESENLASTTTTVPSPCDMEAIQVAARLGDLLCLTIGDCCGSKISEEIRSALAGAIKKLEDEVAAAQRGHQNGVLEAVPSPGPRPTTCQDPGMQAAPSLNPGVLELIDDDEDSDLDDLDGDVCRKLNFEALPTPKSERGPGDHDIMMQSTRNSGVSASVAKMHVESRGGLLSQLSQKRDSCYGQIFEDDSVLGPRAQSAARSGLRGIASRARGVKACDEHGKLLTMLEPGAQTSTLPRYELVRAKRSAAVLPVPLQLHESSSTTSSLVNVARFGNCISKTLLDRARMVADTEKEVILNEDGEQEQVYVEDVLSFLPTFETKRSTADPTSGTPASEQQEQHQLQALSIKLKQLRLYTALKQWLSTPAAAEAVNAAVLDEIFAFFLYVLEKYGSVANLHLVQKLGQFFDNNKSRGSSRTTSSGFSSFTSAAFFLERWLELCFFAAMDQHGEGPHNLQVSRADFMSLQVSQEHQCRILHSLLAERVLPDLASKEGKTSWGENVFFSTVLERVVFGLVDDTTRVVSSEILSKLDERSHVVRYLAELLLRELFTVEDGVCVYSLLAMECLKLCQPLAELALPALVDMVTTGRTPHSSNSGYSSTTSSTTSRSTSTGPTSTLELDLEQRGLALDMIGNLMLVFGETQADNWRSVDEDEDEMHVGEKIGGKKNLLGDEPGGLLAGEDLLGEEDPLLAPQRKKRKNNDHGAATSSSAFFGGMMLSSDGKNFPVSSDEKPFRAGQVQEADGNKRSTTITGHSSSSRRAAAERTRHLFLTMAKLLFDAAAWTDIEDGKIAIRAASFLPKLVLTPFYPVVKDFVVVKAKGTIGNGNIKGSLPILPGAGTTQYGGSSSSTSNHHASSSHLAQLGAAMGLIGQTASSSTKINLQDHQKSSTITTSSNQNEHKTKTLDKLVWERMHGLLCDNSDTLRIAGLQQLLACVTGIAERVDDFEVEALAAMDQMEEDHNARLGFGGCGGVGGGVLGLTKMKHRSSGKRPAKVNSASATVTTSRTHARSADGDGNGEKNTGQHRNPFLDYLLDNASAIPSSTSSTTAVASSASSSTQQTYCQKLLDRERFRLGGAVLLDTIPVLVLRRCLNRLMDKKRPVRKLGLHFAHALLKSRLLPASLRTLFLENCFSLFVHMRDSSELPEVDRLLLDVETCPNALAFLLPGFLQLSSLDGFVAYWKRKKHFRDEVAHVLTNLEKDGWCVEERRRTEYMRQTYHRETFKALSQFLGPAGCSMQPLVGTCQDCLAGRQSWESVSRSSSFHEQVEAVFVACVQRWASHGTNSNSSSASASATSNNAPIMSGSTTGIREQRQLPLEGLLPEECHEEHDDHTALVAAPATTSTASSKRAKTLASKNSEKKMTAFLRVMERACGANSFGEKSVFLRAAQLGSKGGGMKNLLAAAALDPEGEDPLGAPKDVAGDEDVDMDEDAEADHLNKVDVEDKKVDAQSLFERFFAIADGAGGAGGAHQKIVKNRNDRSSSTNMNVVLQQIGRGSGPPGATSSSSSSTTWMKANSCSTATATTINGGFSASGSATGSIILRDLLLFLGSGGQSDCTMVDFSGVAPERAVGFLDLLSRLAPQSLAKHATLLIDRSSLQLDQTMPILGRIGSYCSRLSEVENYNLVRPTSSTAGASAGGGNEKLYKSAATTSSHNYGIRSSSSASSNFSGSLQHAHVEKLLPVLKTRPDFVCKLLKSVKGLCNRELFDGVLRSILNYVRHRSSGTTGKSGKTSSSSAHELARSANHRVTMATKLIKFLRSQQAPRGLYLRANSLSNGGNRGTTRWNGSSTTSHGGGGRGVSSFASGGTLQGQERGTSMMSRGVGSAVGGKIAGLTNVSFEQESSRMIIDHQQVAAGGKILNEATCSSTSTNAIYNWKKYRDVWNDIVSSCCTTSGSTTSSTTSSSSNSAVLQQLLFFAQMGDVARLSVALQRERDQSEKLLIAKMPCSGSHGPASSKTGSSISTTSNVRGTNTSTSRGCSTTLMPSSSSTNKKVSVFRAAFAALCCANQPGPETNGTNAASSLVAQDDQSPSTGTADDGPVIDEFCKLTATFTGDEEKLVANIVGLFSKYLTPAYSTVTEELIVDEFLWFSTKLSRYHATLVLPKMVVLQTALACFVSASISGTTTSGSSGGNIINFNNTTSSTTLLSSTTTAGPSKTTGKGSTTTTSTNVQSTLQTVVVSAQVSSRASGTRQSALKRIQEAQLGVLFRALALVSAPEAKTTLLSRIAIGVLGLYGSSIVDTENVAATESFLQVLVPIFARFHWPKKQLVHCLDYLRERRRHRAKEHEFVKRVLEGIFV
ncbi:unnamed protein product [Amoebophrya sp. A25]|nr:unnamed protein product [Amoebophrya sp. A25]|eukprot:GSA25T00006831001.1